MPNVNPILKAAGSSGASPAYINHLPRSSGDVLTGEVQTVRGGGRCATIYSGNILPSSVFSGNSNAPGAFQSGGQVMFFSGAGRLNSVLPLTQMQSGLPVYFYDAAGITVSGISVSGQRIIGILPPTYPGSYFVPAATSGTAPFPLAFNQGQPFNMDMPFQSGLCAAIPSGTPGFTLSWTVEVSAGFPNN